LSALERPELYIDLTPTERFYAMARLCARQWLAHHPPPPKLPRSEWPGEKTTVTGVDFDEAWRQRRTFELEYRKIPCIGRRALLANKRAAALPKDLADVAWLETRPEPD